MGFCQGPQGSRSPWPQLCLIVQSRQPGGMAVSVHHLLQQGGCVAGLSLPTVTLVLPYANAQELRTPYGTRAHLRFDTQLTGGSCTLPVSSLPKAIMQTMARKNEWPLDKICLTVDVTKKTKEDYGHPPREGAYLHGLLMEGKTLQGIHTVCV